MAEIDFKDFKKFFVEKSGIKLKDDPEIQIRGDEARVSFFVGVKVKSKDLLNILGMYMAEKLGSKPLEDGDFCSKGGIGCAEFEVNGFSFVAFFTNYSGSEGEIIIGCNKYKV